MLLVAPAGSESAAQQALDCGAVGVVERPLDASGAAARAGRGRLLRRARSASRAREDEGHIALLGAGGGMGTTTCAVALAAAHERVFVLDLALATGDAAEVPASQSPCRTRCCASPAARSPRRPSSRPALAHGEACRVLPAPALPEHADLIDERGIARVLDLAVASGLRAIVDCGARVGVETIPVLERASLVAIVASADARGARGARRTALLIARLGLSGRASASSRRGCRNPRAARRRSPQMPDCRCSRP